jgi:group I intron endonuclease
VYLVHSSLEPLNVIYGLHLGDRRYRYIGLTTKGASYRLAGHISSSKTLKYPLYRWISKHGSESIHIDVIEVCHQNDLADREKYWIAFYREVGNTLLNLTDGGDGVSGHRHSVETRAKMSTSRTGLIRSEAHRLSQSISLTGLKRSEETKQRISQSKSGTNHPNYGRTLSPETRSKISQANKGQTPTDESIARIKKYNAERVWTAEDRAKLSAAKIGNTNSRRTAHVRWHTNKNVSKPDTCKYCKEESTNGQSN